MALAFGHGSGIALLWINDHFDPSQNLLAMLKTMLG
jgi:hypothetical protein